MDKDTENLIQKIANLFTSFETLHLTIDLVNNDIQLYEDELNQDLTQESGMIENDLRVLYMAGKDENLQRIRKELIKIQENLKNIDYGINFSIEGRTETYSIECEQLTNLSKLKLTYIDKLHKKIDSYLGYNKPLNSYHLRDLMGAEKWEKLYNWLFSQNAIDTNCKYIKLKNKKLDLNWIATLVYRTLQQRNYLLGELKPETAGQIILSTFQCNVSVSAIQKTKELKDLKRGLPPYE